MPSHHSTHYSPFKMAMKPQSSALLFVLLLGIASTILASLEEQKSYYHGHHGSKSPSCGGPPSCGTGSSPQYKPPSGTSPLTPVTPAPLTPVDPYTPDTPVAPLTPVTPVAPLTPITPVTPATPMTPIYPVPPATPMTPIYPVTPATPFTPLDPYSPFSCFYWSTHPSMIWSLFGWWCPLSSAFGVSSLPGLSPITTIPQALSNGLDDGYGMLYREGTASLLNSMVNKNFPFSVSQVKKSFVSSLKSEPTALHQGKLFQMANQGKIKKNL